MGGAFVCTPESAQEWLSVSPGDVAGPALLLPKKGG